MTPMCMCESRLSLHEATSKVSSANALALILSHKNGSELYRCVKQGYVLTAPGSQCGFWHPGHIRYLNDMLISRWAKRWPPCKGMCSS